MNEQKEINPNLEELKEVTKDYITRLDSLETSLPLSMILIELGEQAYGQARTKYLKKHGEVKSENENATTYTIKMEYVHELEKTIEKPLDSFSKATDLIPQSYIVTLVSQFDILLSKLLKIFFTINPSALNSSQREFKYEQLVNFKSIEEAREYLVEKEIDSFLRDSHVDQFKYLEDKFGITLRKDLDSWPKFIEITERRNLFVHTDGKVSHQYLSVCNENHVHFEKTPNVGEVLTVNSDYFTTAYMCLFEIGFKLIHVFWRKFFKDYINDADLNFIEVTYDLIQEERYELVIKLLDFCVCDLKKHKDDNKKVLIINRAQAYKWNGDENKYTEILDGEDWSACSDDYKICVAVLKNDFSEASKIMKRIGPSSDFENYYRNWPVFKEFRKSDEFKTTYKSIYGKDTIEEISEKGNRASLKLRDVFSKINELTSPTKKPK